MPSPSRSAGTTWMAPGRASSVVRSKAGWLQSARLVRRAARSRPCGASRTRPPRRSSRAVAVDVRGLRVGHAREAADRERREAAAGLRAQPASRRPSRGRRGRTRRGRPRAGPCGRPRPGRTTATWSGCGHLRERRPAPPPARSGRARSTTPCRMSQASSSGRPSPSRSARRDVRHGGLRRERVLERRSSGARSAARRVGRRPGLGRRQGHRRRRLVVREDRLVVLRERDRRPRRRPMPAIPLPATMSAIFSISAPPGRARQHVGRRERVAGDAERVGRGASPFAAAAARARRRRPRADARTASDRRDGAGVEHGRRARAARREYSDARRLIAASREYSDCAADLHETRRRRDRRPRDPQRRAARSCAPLAAGGAGAPAAAAARGRRRPRARRSSRRSRPRASGITFVHDNAMSPERYLPETMGPGVRLPRLRQRRLDGHLPREQRPLRLLQAEGAAAQRALPQQPRRHVHRRDREGRRGRRHLRHGRGRRRLRQRRLPRPASSPPTAAASSTTTTATARSPT